jgi:Do/DeqQ family serine protease
MKRTAVSVLAAIALTALTIGSFGLSAREPAGIGAAHADSQLTQGEESIADVTEKALPSVVNISSKQAVRNQVSPFYFDPFFGEPTERQQKRYAQSLGSGVIVSSKGFVVTNNHVVANSTEIVVSLSDGREYKAKVVGSDPKSDLAVLKLQGSFKDLKPIAFGDSSKPRLGDVVLAIGNPFGVGQTVTMGIVSAKGRGNMGIVDYEDFIQTDAAINPGNSGGALINTKGELIGINTAILSRTGGYQGVGFAIPTNMVKPIMDSLIANGKVVRGYLGIGIQDVTDDLAVSLGLKVKKGVLVTQVQDGGPAAKAGLHRDDVIVKVGAQSTLSARALRTAIANAGAKQTVDVEFYRGGNRKTVSVMLTEQPDDEAAWKGGSDEENASADSSGLGIRVQPLNAKLRKKYGLPSQVNYGVVVTGVDPNGLAAQYLQPGDIVLELNRTKITSAKQLGQLYRAAKNKVALRVYREGMAVYLMFSK